MRHYQAVLLAAALVVLLLAKSIYVVDQRAVGLLLEFDEIKDAGVAPGIHVMIPFAEQVRKFDRRLLSDVQNATVATSDQKALEVESYVEWRIADVAAYYRATNGQDLVADDRLLTIINRSLRETLGMHSLEQVVTGDRAQLDTALTADAEDKARELGMEVVDVRLRSIGLSKDVAEAYYERMRAERRSVAEDLRARGGEAAEKQRADAEAEAQTTLADAYRKAETLRGEGDAKAAEIYAKAYGQDPDFFAFYRSLEAYRDAFAGKRDVLVVEPKGQFFKYFKDASGGK